MAPLWRGFQFKWGSQYRCLAHGRPRGSNRSGEAYPSSKTIDAALRLAFFAVDHAGFTTTSMAFPSDTTTIGNSPTV
jgi:hypothetical protein